MGGGAPDKTATRALKGQVAVDLVKGVSLFLSRKEPEVLAVAVGALNKRLGYFEYSPCNGVRYLFKLLGSECVLQTLNIEFVVAVLLGALESE